jgi:hypothetical protein
MELKTINIKGNDYVQVNERVRAFRTHPDFANMSIETSIVELSENRVLMLAKVLDVNGIVRSTGHAEEILTSHGVNSTSFIENCESSAVGRCLGFLGIGVDTSIASGEEVERATNRQESNAEEKRTDENSVNKERQINWKEIKCPVGKYKEKLMGEIFTNDPNYLTWMVKNMEAKTPDFQIALNSAAKALNNNGNQGFKLGG